MESAPKRWFLFAHLVYLNPSVSTKQDQPKPKVSTKQEYSLADGLWVQINQTLISSFVKSDLPRAKVLFKEFLFPLNNSCCSLKVKYSKRFSVFSSRFEKRNKQKQLMGDNPSL